MHAFIFFSVYESLFEPIARGLVERYGVTRVSGFVWGHDQQEFLERSKLRLEPLFVFSRDILPRVPANPNVEYLAACERRYGTPIHHILAAERHLSRGRSYEELLGLVEAIFRHVEHAYEQHRPDFVFSENVSCMTSLIHHLVARGKGIPFYSIGQSRITNPLIISRDGLQDYAHVRQRFEALQQRELTAAERDEAVAFVEAFRERPVKYKGQEIHGRTPAFRREDVSRFIGLVQHVEDRGNPTQIPPRRAVVNRLRRIFRISIESATKLFETTPPAGERYVLYPLHVQPEASTLVQAPYYLDQIALIEDVAKSLPIGHRLYVKEHAASRGRRPIEFYERIKNVLGVRLLGPDVATWPLIQNAAAVVVITGTMGWESVLLRRPVITFGNVFFNDLPHVHKAKDVTKDQLAGLLRRAIFEHRHDEEVLLRFVVALLDGTEQGEWHNPRTITRVLEPENVRLVTDALARRVGLAQNRANT